MQVVDSLVGQHEGALAGANGREEDDVPGESASEAQDTARLQHEPWPTVECPGRLSCMGTQVREEPVAFPSSLTSAVTRAVPLRSHLLGFSSQRGCADEQAVSKCFT